MSHHEEGRATQGRPIKRLLVANRGEIAVRILSTAREHHPPIETYVCSTKGDTGHTLHADHVVTLPSASSYLNIDTLLATIRQHKIDTVHPGYGFLSESADFARRAWEEASAVVVGPGAEILARTGDKLMARELARECDVPVLEATTEPMESVDDIQGFVQEVGLPVMLKAVDGGGGRGIRLVKRAEELESLAQRAIAESPSKRVFVEKAAVDGFRHIEVQILGDGTGKVRHLWERECSIQRRYQKIVEIAPSTIADRNFVAGIIEAAVRMASSIRYRSLGTFEFLANPNTEEFFFLEVNPRLQVEHTITESISQVDVVEAQLKLAEGRLLNEVLPIHLTQDPSQPPPQYSLQLRICAENPDSNFSLSIGPIKSYHFPSGNGIRIDTALVSGHEASVSADFDSLIAKVVVTASSWDAVVRKARRALRDTNISGVKTNLGVLRSILASEAFELGRCDTTWFEANMDTLVQSGRQISAHTVDGKFFAQPSTSGGSSGMPAGLSSSTVLFRKGDAWTVKLGPAVPKGSDSRSETHHLKFDKVMRNEFPTLLQAQISYASPTNPEAQLYSITLNATSASSSSTMVQGKHRRGDPSNDGHVVIPFPGKLVEVLVDEGDVLGEGDVVCIVQQMKMELEVRTKRAGRVSWVTEIEDGEDVAEGDLAVELDVDGGARPKL